MGSKRTWLRSVAWAVAALVFAGFIAWARPSASTPVTAWSHSDGDLRVTVTVDDATPEVGQPVRLRVVMTSTDTPFETYRTQWAQANAGNGFVADHEGGCTHRARQRYLTLDYQVTYSPGQSGSVQPITVRVGGSTCASQTPRSVRISGAVFVQPTAARSSFATGRPISPRILSACRTAGPTDFEVVVGTVTGAASGMSIVLLDQRSHRGTALIDDDHFLVLGFARSDDAVLELRDSNGRVLSSFNVPRRANFDAPDPHPMCTREYAGRFRFP